MTHLELMKVRALEKEVHSETDRAREQFPGPISVEELPFHFGLTSLTEEVGKLARCYNKLFIVKDHDTLVQWRQESRLRIRTAISLLERLYMKMEDEASARYFPPEATRD